MGKVKNAVKSKPKSAARQKKTKTSVTKTVEKAKGPKLTRKKPVKLIVPKPKKSYSREALAFFKKIILKQKSEMVEEIESLNDRMMDSTTHENTDSNSVYSLHMADQGTDAMEREKTFLLAQRSDDHIRRLDESLKRIEDGTYGVCIVCGDLIEKQRLEAVPTTQKHVDCKNKLKKLQNEPNNF